VKGWLLDANILSELRRRRPEPKVVEFVAAQPLDLLYVSVVTLDSQSIVAKPTNYDRRRETVSPVPRSQMKSDDRLTSPQLSCATVRN
jgi:predicted nucleic acid-binding protein